MFIGNEYNILSNPEGIVCQKCRNYTYNPFGIEAYCSKMSYKHIFPSGMFIHKIILKIYKMYYSVYWEFRALSGQNPTSKIPNILRGSFFLRNYRLNVYKYPIANSKRLVLTFVTPFSLKKASLSFTCRALNSMDECGFIETFTPPER
jgi:hypothetical protein